MYEACPEAATGGSCSGDLASKHCRALPVHRSTYHYRSRRAGQAHLSKRIREIAATRVPFRIHVLLRREGWQVNPKWVYRLYREMGV